ncbi:MAG: proton-conducting transporter membrane subunit, partial [Desulfobulbaceae bacterium]|nr:proton-conducting transporter membrane subunit [Desulfobulbaceae bacterium]
LFAAVIAITQTDIKRILAFSTLSQLGYMMFSLGVAKTVHGGLVESLGFTASMFHIFTHAFFKCLLFLAAGAVIHAVHSNELKDMGGLRKFMPWTYGAVLAACLAIGGVFPFSGFWSKDEILLAALHAGHPIIFITGLLVGGITAFYMFRFFFLIFHGESSSEHQVHEDPVMTLPIVILAVPSVLIGYLAKDFFADYMTPPVVTSMLAPAQAHPHWLPFVASMTGLAGVFGAWFLYGRGNLTLAAGLQQRFALAHRTLVAKFYIDEIYLYVTHKIIFRFIAGPIKWFDRHIVDGSMNLTGWLLQLGGTGVRLLQNGLVTRYLGLTMLGIAFVYFCG